MIYLTADFETTGEAQYKIDGYTRVFMYAVYNIDKDTIENYGTTIDEFFDFANKTRKDRTITCYFHNLKFDGSFLLYYLLTNSYTDITSLPKEEHNKFEKTFSTLITSQGIWYGITVKIKKAKYSLTLHFKDSFKKIPLSVKKTAQSYKLEIQKGDFDYNMYRPIGYKPTAEEWDYVFRDVKIMGIALKTQLDEKMIKSTLSSDSYNNFKSYYTKDQFKYLFPELDRKLCEDLRKAYKGGWVYSNERVRNNDLENVLSFDVNSLYSWAMSDKNLLPYGKPIIYNGKYIEDKAYPLYIQTIAVSFKLKDDHLPTLQTSSLGRFAKDQFLTDTENEMVELTLTNIDLELLLKHHDIYAIEYLYGYKFKATNKLFQRWLDKWFPMKQHAPNDGLRLIAKLILNALYGKFGTNPKKRDKTVYLEDGVVKFKTGDEYESTQSYYLPIAIFTTANARKLTIDYSQKLFKYHAYSDTDSIKLVGITYEEASKLLPVHPTEMGYFKFEETYIKSRFVRAKTYIYKYFNKKEDKIDFKIVCSGMTDSIKEEITDMDDFNIGFKSKNKLTQVQVKGGAILKKTNFEIK